MTARKDGQLKNKGSSRTIGEKQMKVNLNEYAQSLAEREGGKKQVDIAQIKEILTLISMDLFVDYHENDGELFYKLKANGKAQFKEIKPTSN